MTLSKDVSIILVNYNSTQLLVNAVHSILTHTKRISFEIIIVDNASPDDGVQVLSQEFGNKVILIESKKNLGFGGANNLGIEKAQGKYLFLLNPDTILLNDAISIFYDYAEQNQAQNIGALGTVLLDANLKPSNSYGRFLTPTNVLFESLPNILKKTNKPHITTNPFKIDFITGADLFIPHTVIKKTGLFDTRFFMYCEEVDLQKRMEKLGFQRIIIPSCKIIHYDGGSYNIKNCRSARRRLEYDRSKCIYIKKHFSIISYICFRVLFFLIRIPAFLNPYYRWKENISYLRMLISS